MLILASVTCIVFILLYNYLYMVLCLENKGIYLEDEHLFYVPQVKQSSN